MSVESKECGGSGGTAGTAKWQRKADTRPQEILDAAKQVLKEKGYRAFRLDDVAARAGVTKPLIYHYFADKDELIRRTLEASMDNFLVRLRAESEAVGGNWETRLRRFIELIWNRWASPEWGRFHVVLGEMRTDNPSLFKGWIEHSVGHRVRTVRELLEEGRDELVSGLDLDSAAAFLVCGSWQLVHLHAHLGAGPLEEFRSDEVRGDVLDIFLRGIRAPKGNGAKL